MTDFAPHTPDDVERMLRVVGRASLDDLFAHVPDEVRPPRPFDLPRGRSEDEVVTGLTRLAGRNAPLTCFAGGGAYDHWVPAVVDAITARGELLTAYTPYQPEVSQGILQILFEFQTMVCELTGLEVANASLYDGASAVAEAVAMAGAVTGRDAVAVSAALDGPIRTVVDTYAHPVRRPVRTLPIDPATGTTPTPGDLPADTAAVVVSQPNGLGVVEDVRSHAEVAHAAGALLIVELEPTAVGLLATPGAQGADIVVGDGQPLGQGLRSGGPTVGFLACARRHARRLPGRVVGAARDADGRSGYVMTLRTREQDIRRERATSNICTNQTLGAVAAAVTMSWLGPRGLRDLATACLAGARAAHRRLTGIDGVTAPFTGPFLKEFALRLDGVDARRVVAGLCDDGLLIGPVVDDPAGGGPLVLVAVTERRTAEDIERLGAALAQRMAVAAGGRGVSPPRCRGVGTGVRWR